MAYQGFADGLYVMRQLSRDKGVLHYAIMDVGNRLGLAGVLPGAEPIMIHKPPTGLRSDFLSATGQWTTVGSVADESGVRARLTEAFKNPGYDLFGDNCEHLVNFLATGERWSTQVLVGGLIVVGVFAWAASRFGKAA